jgi:ribose/xylose/arabinose/galactoside ABC-type transport system permease subunit
MFGVLMLGVLGNCLTQLDVDSYAREIKTGSIIIPAIAGGQSRTRAARLIVLRRASSRQPVATSL